MELSNKVAIVICYLGKMPDYFSSFLITCRNNPNFNWIIITDDVSFYDAPQNVTIKHLSIDDIRKRIKSYIGDWAGLESPYKLCDYKPAFGLIFEDYLKGYSHWGYGDIDVVYGELNSFISPEMLQKYDKIFPLGHLSIYKNNEACRKAFMLPADGTNDFREVYSKNSSFYFDEYQGINEKMNAHGLRVYYNIDFLDASSGGYSRIHLIDKRIFKLVFRGSQLAHLDYPPNYKKQCFVIMDKRLFHVYSIHKTILKSEYAYLHFRRRMNVQLSDANCNMIIGKSDISELNAEITDDLIDHYNKMTIPDDICFIQFVLKRGLKKTVYFLKWKPAEILYSIKPVRKIIRTIRRQFKK